MSKSLRGAFGARIINTLVNVVPEGHQVLRERLGKFHKAEQPGWFVAWPFIDRLRGFDMRERPIRVDPQQVITKDNVVLTVAGNVFIRVVDTEKAAYGIHDVHDAVTQLAISALRAHGGKTLLDTMFYDRESINSSIRAAMSEACMRWGLEVRSYEITSMDFEQHVRDSLSLQASAERERRQQVKAAEASKESKIKESEGKRQSDINLSEGERIKTQNETEARVFSITKLAEATRFKLQTEAEGEATRIITVAKAEADAQRIKLEQQAIGQAATILADADARAQYIEKVSKQLGMPGSAEALQFAAAMNYMNNLKEFAGKSSTNTIWMNQDVSDWSASIAKGMSVAGHFFPTKRNNQ